MEWIGIRRVERCLPPCLSEVRSLERNGAVSPMFPHTQIPVPTAITKAYQKTPTVGKGGIDVLPDGDAQSKVASTPIFYSLFTLKIRVLVIVVFLHSI